jgi:hypothetical protein
VSIVLRWVKHYGSGENTMGKLSDGYCGRRVSDNLVLRQP